MTTEPERLATLEAQMGTAQKERRLLFEKLDKQDDHRDEMRKSLDEVKSDIHVIREKLSSWKGFWSGVMFAISALAALIGGMASALWNRVFG